MAERALVQVELRFVTEDDPGALTDRIRESVGLIVGRDRLEEFRFRTMPLDAPRHLRSVGRPDRGASGARTGSPPPE